MTFAELAADVGLQPDSIRCVIRYLEARRPDDLIDETAITDAQAERIRDTIAGVMHAVLSHCPELH